MFSNVVDVGSVRQNCSIGSIRMNDEDQEVPLYNEIFQYLKHGEYRVDASKSKKLEGDSQKSTQFHEEGLLYLKSDMTCNSGLLRAFDTSH